MFSRILNSAILNFGIFVDKQELLDTIQSLFYKILITMDSIIYYLIDICYQVFLALSKARIFSDNLFGAFIKRFYVLVGVLMLFFVVYTLMRVIVNPDDMTKGNMAPGKVVGNILTSIILIALLPTIFNLLYTAQDVLLDNDLVGRIVIGGTTSDEIQSSVKKGGRQIAVGVFSAFFYPEDGKADSEITALDEYKGETPTLEEAKNKFVEEEVSFMVFTSFSKNAATDEIHYSWFISAIAGAFCLYVVVSFVFDLGIRAVKLAVLQIIAPIPVLLRIVPGKDKSFNNWVSTTAGTFFEVFIRVLVIYLIALIAGQITVIMDGIFESVNDVKGPVKFTTQAFLLMGVIAFAKQAPKMISDILGIKTGDMKLGIRDKLKEGGGFVAAGAIGAGATVATRNAFNAGRNIKNAKGAKAKAGAAVRGLGSFVGGAASGVIRGGIAGGKAKTYGDVVSGTSKAAQDAVEKRINRESYREEHPGFMGTTRGHVADAAKAVARWATGENTQALQERRNKISAVQSANNDVFSEIKKDILENEDKYVVMTGTGADRKQRLLSHLHQELDQATNAVTQFDKQKYIDDYKNSVTNPRGFDRDAFVERYKAVNRGATDEMANAAAEVERKRMLSAEAEVAADAEVKRLSSKQFNAQSVYNKALDDAIKVQNQYERGLKVEDQAYNLKNVDGELVGGIKFKNEQIQVKADGSVTIMAEDDKGAVTGGRVNTVDVKINAADQAIQSNRAEIMRLAEKMRKDVNALTGEPILSDDDYKAIKDALEKPNSVVDKSVRNAIGNIVNEMDKEIAKRRQQEKKDKK